MLQGPKAVDSESTTAQIGVYQSGLPVAQSSGYEEQAKAAMAEIQSDSGFHDVLIAVSTGFPPFCCCPGR